MLWEELMMQRCSRDPLLQQDAGWFRSSEMMEKGGLITGGSVLPRPRGVSWMAADSEVPQMFS